MGISIQQQSQTKILRPSFLDESARRWRMIGLLGLSLCATLALSGQASAGVGCDLNVRVNNHTKNSITVYGAAHSGASKTGLNIWAPLQGMVDTVLDPKDSGSASHTKQAVELQLPCWTGKVDFRIRYLDGSHAKWMRRDAVKIKNGQTVQINIKN
ncbi:MAG: hypothetical protein MRJ96_09570 [Nitrospirales bacterium]|nr:hypothetical protein [Nitrospira sp.]MDR4501683.1 hypothetical protein [Nitrospirales bacterium]